MKKAAAELVFCLDRLRDLAEAQPDRAPIWRMRAKALGFLVGFHDLRSTAERCPLTDEEKNEVAANVSVLRPPVKPTRRIEPEEVQKLRREVRRVFAPNPTDGSGRGDAG